MSDAEHHAEAPAAGAAAPAKKGGMLPWLAVGAVSAGLGAAVPIALSMMGTSSAHGHSSAPAATDSHGHAAPAKGKADGEMAIVNYGEVATNLNDGRMNRYLRINIALHVRSTDKLLVEEAVKSKNLIIRDWLVNHVGDKSLDDVRGKAGQNMLRREIRDYFNATLFTDSYDRIYEILFTEFAIQ